MVNINTLLHKHMQASEHNISNSRKTTLFSRY